MSQLTSIFAAFLVLLCTWDVWQLDFLDWDLKKREEGGGGEPKLQIETGSLRSPWEVVGPWNVLTSLWHHAYGAFTVCTHGGHIVWHAELFFSLTQQRITRSRFIWLSVCCSIVKAMKRNHCQGIGNWMGDWIYLLWLFYQMSSGLCVCVYDIPVSKSKELIPQKKSNQ